MKRLSSFAAQLHVERTSHGWSQEQVAEKIGCDVKTVVRWENDESIPSIKYRTKISAVFGKTLAQLHFVLKPASQQALEQPVPSRDVLNSEHVTYHLNSTNEATEITKNMLPGDPSPQKPPYKLIPGFVPPTHPKAIQQRDHLVKDIYAKLLQPDITALVLTGIVGIGKSTLAALIYHYAEKQHQAGTGLFTAKPIWLTINECVTLADVLGTLFAILEKPLPSLEDQNPRYQAMMLFQALNTLTHARLIVLDQFENVLDWQTGYALVERPSVGEWLDAINSEVCLCKILLTSRIWPKGTQEYPPVYMQEYHVRGLNETEGITLLKKQGVEPKQASPAQLRKAIKLSEGHPLALTLLASLLRQDRSLSLSLLFKNPVYRKLWQGNIAKQLLDFIYLQQLNEIQRKLLSAFAIYQIDATLEAALAIIDLRGYEDAQIAFSFHTLLQQSLLQATGRGHYHLHAIVVEYLHGQDEGENNLLSAHYKAAHYYLKLAAQYAPPLRQRQSIDDVQTFTRATWHLCQAQRWQEAYTLIQREELYPTLRRFGENATLLELYQILQPSEKWQPERTWEAEIYDHLGRMYAIAGKKTLALRNYERALRTYEVIGDCQEKGRTLHHLGLLYENLGQDLRAKTLHEQALTLARETKDSKGEADSLNALGWTYHRLMQPDEALRYCEMALTIHQEQKNAIGESDTLNTLGLIHHKHGNMDMALQYYTKSLVIRREIKNREKEGKVLNHLGLVYADLNQIENAQEYYKQSLLIRKAIGDYIGEGVVLYNLAKIYFNLHLHDVTLACLLTAGKIFKNVRNNDYEATQRWLEKVQKSMGKVAYKTLKEHIDANAYEIITKALNTHTTQKSGENE